jgi:hypothetical protein
MSAHALANALSLGISDLKGMAANRIARVEFAVFVSNLTDDSFRDFPDF